MCASWINKSQLFMMHDRVINPFLEVINLSIAMSTLPTTVKFSWCWWNHFVTIAGQFYRCQLNVRYILPMVVDVTFIVLEPFFKFANAEIPQKICKSREVCGCVTLTIDHWSISKNWRPQHRWHLNSYNGSFETIYILIEWCTQFLMWMSRFSLPFFCIKLSVRQCIWCEDKTCC